MKIESIVRITLCQNDDLSFYDNKHDLTKYTESFSDCVIEESQELFDFYNVNDIEINIEKLDLLKVSENEYHLTLKLIFTGEELIQLIENYDKLREFDHLLTEKVNNSAYATNLINKNLIYYSQAEKVLYTKVIR